MPLLLSHGWPGSVFEFHKIIPLLTEHFTVVAPSLPGYTLSFKPGQPRFGVIEIADMFAELMSALGYTRFGAQGGDWGSFITSVLGHRYPAAPRPASTSTCCRCGAIPRCCRTRTPRSRRISTQLNNFLKEETGYQWIQGTKPQTLAFGLTDSPAGPRGVDRGEIPRLDRQQRQPGGRGQPRRDAGQHLALLVHRRDRLVVLAVLCAHARAVADPGRRDRSRCRWAMRNFRKEILSPPRSLAETTYTDIRRWTTMPKGGHFAALEQPEALAREVIAFFQEL